MAVTAYEKIIDRLLKMDGGPFWAQRTARAILKDLEAEAGAAALIRVMVDDADRLDAEWQRQDEERNDGAWPRVRARLEEIGCRVLLSAPGEWSVLRPSGHTIAKVYMPKGRVKTQLGGGLDVDLDNLFDMVNAHTFRRGEAIAEEKRLREIRQTHQWNNRGKSWAPRSGSGPLLRWSTIWRRWVEVPPT
jgi:hypothetical protein